MLWGDLWSSDGTERQYMDTTYYIQWTFLTCTLHQIRIGHKTSYNAQYIFWVLYVRVLRYRPVSQVLPPRDHNSNLRPPTRHSLGANSWPHAGYIKALHVPKTYLLTGSPTNTGITQMGMSRGGRGIRNTHKISIGILGERTSLQRGKGV